MKKLFGLVAAAAIALAMGMSVQFSSPQNAVVAQVPSPSPAPLTIGQGVSPWLFPSAVLLSTLGQSASNTWAVRKQLATGVYAWTFATPFVYVPICTGSEEASTGHYVKITTAPSTTGVTFTSDVTTSNTDYVDLACIGNPY